MFASTLQVSDVYHKIVEYLNPRELYNLTLSSGYSSGLTLSLVVKVCLLRGNKNTKISLERIYAKVLSNKIYVPSAHRLLFLLTSSTCECCGVNRVNLVSDYGLLLCLSCKQKHTTQIDTKSPKLLKSNVEVNDLMAHANVSSIVHHFVREAPYNWESNRLPVYYMMIKPCFDMKKCNIGPVITSLHLKEMLHLPNYSTVELYIKDREPDQADIRLEFIDAMTMHRQKCFVIKQKEENDRISSVRKYRLNKFQNVQTAIALLRRNIPDGLKYVLNFQICTTFQVSVSSGVTYICRYVPRSSRSTYPYYSILGSVRVNDVKVMLDEGPPNGKVFIRIMNASIRQIVQPLVNCPSKFNIQTSTKHQERLLGLAREICMFMGAEHEENVVWN